VEITYYSNKYKLNPLHLYRSLGLTPPEYVTDISMGINLSTRYPLTEPRLDLQNITENLSPTKTDKPYNKLSEAFIDRGLINPQDNIHESFLSLITPSYPVYPWSINKSTSQP